MDIDTEAIRRLRDHLLARTEPDDLERGRCGIADIPEIQASYIDAILSRVQPFAETMYLVMVCDERPDPVEHDTLIAAIAALTDGQLSRRDIEVLLEQFDRNAQQGGIEARLAQIGTRLCADADDRETAFSLGAVVALADEHVDVRENQALQWVRTHYGVSERRAAVILGSMN